jgi:hypothetical protein
MCSGFFGSPMSVIAWSFGDWVVGTGSAVRKRAGFVVFAMKVGGALTFEEYWADKRFFQKRPNLRGSKKQAFGDNIYHRKPEGSGWLQLNSHHSLPDGQPNTRNIGTDNTSVNRVLISETFTYWGGSGPQIPVRFRDYHGKDIVCTARHHRSIFSDDLVREVLEWLVPLAHDGYVGEPLDWARTP